MKYYFWPILLIHPSLLSSQNVENSIPYRIEFFFNPEFNILHPGNPIGFEKSESKLGLTFGLNAKIPLSSGNSFKTGLSLAVKKFNHTHEGLVFGSDIDSTGIVSMSKIESKLNYYQIQLPLIYQFNIVNTYLIISGGIELSYPLASNSDRVIYYGNGVIERLNNSAIHKALNYSPIINIGFEIPINNKFNFLAEATFKYNLKAFIIPESNLLSCGIKFSVSFKA